jgi:hypothetical protein
MLWRTLSKKQNEKRNSKMTTYTIEENIFRSYICKELVPRIHKEFLRCEKITQSKMVKGF